MIEMQKYTKLFLESGLATVKSLVQEANNMLQSFSLSDMGKACDEMQEHITADIKKFKSQLRKFIVDKHTVEIPYNHQTEKLIYEISQNVFSANVDTLDGTHLSHHVVNLPEDVDTSEMVQTYDSERKVMVFKFGKR